MNTRTRFENEAKGNSEMTYYLGLVVQRVESTLEKGLFIG